MLTPGCLQTTQQAGRRTAGSSSLTPMSTPFEMTYPLPPQKPLCLQLPTETRTLERVLPGKSSSPLSSHNATAADSRLPSHARDHLPASDVLEGEVPSGTRPGGFATLPSLPWDKPLKPRGQDAFSDEPLSHLEPSPCVA